MSRRFRTIFWLPLTFAVMISFLPTAQGQSAMMEAGMEPFKIFAVVWRGETEVEDGFKDYLDQRGIPYEFTVRNLNLDRNNAPGIVEEIRQAKPDLVYTWGTGTTTSIFGKVETDTPEKYIRDIPGIFVLVAYPQVTNIVNTYEDPGRIVTGVAFLATIEAQLKSILAYHPFEKIAVIYDSTSGNSRTNVAQLEEAAPKMGMELVVLPIPLNDEGKSDPAALPDLVQQAKQQGAELLYMGPDSFLTRHGEVYTSSAIQAGLPTFASTQAPLKNHRALFGLVTDYHTLGKLAGVQAERILVDGKAPDDLPVARLSRFKLWINNDVVHDLGAIPPMSMITIADFQYTTNN